MKARHKATWPPVAQAVHRPAADFTPEDDRAEAARVKVRAYLVEAHGPQAASMAAGIVRTLLQGGLLR